ncbi:MAG: SdpI family protein [candidate division WOR-3 bacterium]|nr:SdpI family protein [candidate division WOR-3 bacterium]MCX7836855.1 SdpI family protein [candidate division WOR-3 bacterium]
MRKISIIILILTIFSFLISIYFYPKMPERMASHWNQYGEVDGYSKKIWGTFLVPFILFLTILLYFLIPKIDPLKNNILKFINYYDAFFLILCIFFIALHLFLLLWNINIRINPNRFFPIGLGVLFIYVGILLKHAKRNWFVGIRTPWTLSNDNVWQKTHLLGSKLFIIAGIISFLGFFFLKYSYLFVLIPVISFSFFLIIYSYFLYQKEIK